MSDAPCKTVQPPSSAPSTFRFAASSSRVPQAPPARNKDAISLDFESAEPAAGHLGPYCQGRASRLLGDAYQSNPYPRVGRLRYFFDRWNEGWLEADLEEKGAEVASALRR